MDLYSGVTWFESLQIYHLCDVLVENKFPEATTKEGL
jgi:hypothetical protein